LFENFERGRRRRMRKMKEEEDNPQGGKKNAHVSFTHSILCVLVISHIST